MLLYIATGGLEDGIELRTVMEKAQPMSTKWAPATSMILQNRELPCCCQKVTSKGRRADRCKVAGFEDGGGAMNFWSPQKSLGKAKHQTTPGVSPSTPRF